MTRQWEFQGVECERIDGIQGVEYEKLMKFQGVEYERIDGVLRRYVKNLRKRRFLDIPWYNWKSRVGRV